MKPHTSDVPLLITATECSFLMVRASMAYRRLFTLLWKLT